MVLLRSSAYKGAQGERTCVESCVITTTSRSATDCAADRHAQAATANGTKYETGARDKYRDRTRLWPLRHGRNSTCDDRAFSRTDEPFGLFLRCGGGAIRCCILGMAEFLR